MKRLISVLLSVVTLCAAICPAAFADENNGYELETKLLEWFGLDTSSQSKLTRGEYAYWIAKLANLNTEQTNTTFADVQQEYKYSGAVSATAAAGYFSGVRSGVFAKDDELTYLQAIIPLVKLTGYDAYVSRTEVSPKGYIQAAAKAGFGTASDENQKITRQEAAVICAKAFKTKIILTDYSGNTTSVSGETILSHFNDIYKGKGIVTANEYTDMYTERGCMSGKINIDNVEYICEDNSYNDFLARKIDYYYIDNKDGDLQLAAAALNKNAGTLTIKASKDNKIDNGKFSYKTENGKTKDIELERGYDLIFNNKTIFNPTISDLLFVEGELVFIDNDSNGKYESVIARHAESFEIDGIDLFSETIYYKGGSINADSMDDQKYHIFYNVEADGTKNQIDIDYLKKGMILTVYRSYDESYIEAYQTENQVSGVLTEIDEDYITIGDEKYEYIGNIADNIKVGSDVDAYLDYLGYMVKLDESSPEFKYGYLFKILYDELETSARFKIFTTTGLEIYDALDRIYVDGTRMDLSELKNSIGLYSDGKAVKQVIRYKLKSGKLYAIDTETTVDANNEKDSLKCETSKKSMTYYPTISMIGGNVKITDKTLFMALPSLDSELDDEDCYNCSYSLEDYPYSYTFSVYDVDDEQAAGAVLIYPSGSMKGDEKTTVKSSVGIVSKVIDTVNEDNEKVKMISLYTEGDKIETYYTKPNTCENFNAGFGTLAEYVVSNGLITGIKAEFEPGDTPGNSADPATPSSSDYQFRFGKVKQIFDDYLIMITNTANPNFDDSIEHIWLSPAVSEKYFIVDMAERKINAGTSANLHTGSYIMVRSFRAYRSLHTVIYEY